MKERLWFDEFCDNELENFASRLRFFSEVQSHSDATCQIDLLLLFYSYFKIRSSRDVLAILTCVAFFVLVSDVEWCWNRNRSCDVLSRTCRIRQQFCSAYRYDRIFDSWSIVIRCSFWWIAHISSFQKLSAILRTIVDSSFSRWRSRYEESNIFSFFVWLFAIRSSSW